MIRVFLEVDLETAADQMLTDVGIVPITASIRVVDEFVFRKNAPLRVEIIIKTRTELESKAPVIC